MVGERGEGDEHLGLSFSCLRACLCRLTFLVAVNRMSVLNDGPSPPASKGQGPEDRPGKNSMSVVVHRNCLSSDE